MKKMSPYHLRSLFLAFCILIGSQAKATHIFGVDLYYTYVSGNTYTINMAIYGDCSASSTVFNSLYGATPEVQIYNGATLTQTVNLNPQSPQGVEVTPVCASQINNTTCNGGSVPGVRKFVYSKTVTLSAASADWRFHFDGNMGGATQAGRSATITNITGGGGTIIALDAKLNNLNAPNSSSVYTTIPTPFFCLNKPANFNPGAVDPNGDSLSFALVPGINASTNASVNYVNPYTATNPLAVSPGTFAFNSSTGQLSFTPNAIQRSLVVYTVSEYRNGVLVGTSQREMTFVVLSCSNPPPTGSITNLNATGSGVTIVDNTHLTACGSAGLFTFNVNPTDSNATANITVTAAGLPAGATFTVTNNGTNAPVGLFSWNTTGVPPGVYIFFLTFKDDACPLSSTQTIAYTVTILPYPTVSFSLVSAATCIKKAVFHVTTPGLGGVASPYTVKVLQGSTVIHTTSNVTGTITDSLVPGTYTIRVINTNNCNADTTVFIAPPIVITPNLTINSPLCPGGSNGSMSVTATGGNSPYTYALGAGAYSATNTFNNLAVGTYTIHVRDANLCVKDTTFLLPDAPHTFFNASISNPWCNFYNNGSIIFAASNSVSPYTFSLNNSSYSVLSSFTNLGIGIYNFHVKNGNGCITDTTITLSDSLAVTASLAVLNVLCFGGSSGSINVNPSGGFGAPYNYAINAGTYAVSNTFSNLSIGTYTIHVRDVNQCHFDTTVTLVQPSKLVLTPVITNISCFGSTNGVIVINASGGTPAYSYGLNGVNQPSNSFSALAAGTYNLQVSDQHNCITYDTVVVTQPAQLAVSSVAVHNVSCNAGTDGSFTVTPSGGTLPYTYAVDAGAFSASSTLGGLLSGAHTIHIKDANGCTRDSVMSLTQPTAIQPLTAIKNSTCHTLANGAVTLSATGGTPGYMYSNGAGAYLPSGMFTSLQGGNYTFHIKDANGCVKDISITIIDSIIIGGNISITSPLCYGQNNGLISVTGTGGLAPYTYSFSSNPYSNNNTFTNIAAGPDTLHIKDGNGCIKDTIVTVTQPGLIVPSVTITPPTCFGFSNGSVFINATGGTSIFVYAINSGGFVASATFSNLGAGHDTVHVRDNNGCGHDTVINITQPTQLKITGLIISPVKCFGDTSGRVTVAASGATSPYKYGADSSSNFYVSNTLTGLNAGRHHVQVKDNNGCLADSAINISQPTQLAFKLDSLLNPTCEGYKDGYVRLEGKGGTVPYTYAIDLGTFSASGYWTKLAEGNYTFHLQDKNNCVRDTVITLTGYPHIVVQNVAITPVACFNTKTGAIQLVVTGGVQPLSYKLGLYGNVVPKNTFDSLKANEYTIYITDSKNCEKDTTVSVSQPDSLHIATSASPNECVGVDNKGAVTANVSGGTPPYTYLWNTNPAETGTSISGMPNGNYTVWVQDANGCNDSLITAVTYDDCCKPYIPNAFTPNKDGKDDIFRVVFKGDLTIENFSVYNRFGQRVYNTIYIDKGWDGTYNGVPQDMGTYFYYLKALCGNKRDHEIVMEGNVTLIR